MCIAFPARILAIDGDDAVIDLDGRVRHASMLRGPEVEVDDWVLVAAGTVLRRLDAEEAAELGRLLRAAAAATDATRSTPAPASTSPGGLR